MITAAELEERILTSPFHRWLGLRVVSVSPEELRLSATWREEWENGTTARVTHGGILAALLDLAADWALRTEPAADDADYARRLCAAALTEALTDATRRAYAQRGDSGGIG